MTEPTPSVPPAQQQLIIELGSRCRRLIQVLSELAALHTRVDRPEHSDPVAETALRLRKAYHHIRAVIGWPVNDLILHAMGPDVRSAQAHLRPIVAEFLDEPSRAGRPDAVRPSRDSNRKLLEALCHPSPQVLIRPQHRGGLAPGGHVMNLATVFLLLAELACNYNTALGALTQALDSGETSTLLDLMQRAQVEIDSAPIDQLVESLNAQDNKAGNSAMG